MNRAGPIVSGPQAGIRPTCVGMNQGIDSAGPGRAINPPHVRGDEPKRVGEYNQEVKNPPHVRGDEPEQLEQLFEPL